MTENLDEFLDAVELHRQRDALEACLRGFVTALDGFKESTDEVRQFQMLAQYAAAKILLASLDGLKKSRPRAEGPA